MLQTLRRSLPVKVLSHIDSRAVAMEAGISEGVRNSSPTEWGSLENGRDRTGGLQMPTVNSTRKTWVQ